MDKHGIEVLVTLPAPLSQVRRVSPGLVVHGTELPAAPSITLRPEGDKTDGAVPHSGPAAEGRWLTAELAAARSCK
ncbi:MAG: hypothetical protein P8Z49_07785 [Acidobacteriota bacterium]